MIAVILYKRPMYRRLRPTPPQGLDLHKDWIRLSLTNRLHGQHDSARNLHEHFYIAIISLKIWRPASTSPRELRVNGRFIKRRVALDETPEAFSNSVGIFGNPLGVTSVNETVL